MRLALSRIVCVSAAVTFLLCGVVRVAVVRAGAVDMPRVRDVHDIPKPRLGGVAMYSGVVIGVWLASELPALNRGFAPVTSDMNAVVAASFVLMTVGILDDLYDLSALTKLIGQITAALVMSLLGSLVGKAGGNCC